VPLPGHHLKQRLFELAAEHVLDAKVAQQGFVRRTVQSVAAELRRWGQCTYLPNNWHRQSRRRMHREMKRHEITVERVESERLAGEIDSRNLGTGLAQPGRRRRQAKGLAP
tara:strand:+ start:191 stop:523 length:333 start_codon:yes stop_codon:yes gene_type:complete